MRSEYDMAGEALGLLVGQAENLGIRVIENPGVLTLRGRIQALLLLARALNFSHAEVSLLDCETSSLGRTTQ